MTIKPFLLIFFDNSEKACFAILFFNLPCLRQIFYYSKYNIIWIMFQKDDCNVWLWDCFNDN